jgi:spore maturation protein CgeD
MAGLNIVIVSHNKPRFVKEAIQSVLDQTLSDWQGVLMDSGVLLSQGFFGYLHDPRLKVVASRETPELARTKNMASWCFNRLLNSGQLAGELVMYLNDDDLFYPEAFESYCDFYVEHNRYSKGMDSNGSATHSNLRLSECREAGLGHAQANAE